MTQDKQYIVEITYSSGDKHIGMYSEDFVFKNFLRKDPKAVTYRFFQIPDDLSVFAEVTFELQIKEKTA